MKHAIMAAAVVLGLIGLGIYNAAHVCDHKSWQAKAAFDYEVRCTGR